MSMFKFFILILSLFTFALSVGANDVNYIRTIRFEPNPGDMTTQYVGIETSSFLISNSVENKNTMYKKDNYAYKILFYNSKGKVKKRDFLYNDFRSIYDDFLEDTVSYYDIESLSPDITSYRIIPVKSSEIKLEPKNIIKDNISFALSVLNMSLVSKMLQMEHCSYVSDYNKIITTLTENLNKDDNGNYTFNNGVTVKFKKYKDVCTIAPEKKAVTYNEGSCGLITLDFNGNGLPNKYISDNELSDRYKAYLYADTVIPESGLNYSYLYEDKYPAYISTDLNNEIISNYWSFQKKIIVKETTPALMLVIHNYTNKDVEYTIDILFYDDNDNLLGKFSKDETVSALVTGTAGSLCKLPLDFENIPEQARYYSLKIVNDKIKNVNK